MMNNTPLNNELSNNSKKIIKTTSYLLSICIVIYALINTSGIAFLFVFFVSFPLTAMAFSIKYEKHNRLGLPIQYTRRKNKGIFSSFTLFVFAIVLLIIAITADFDGYRETTTAYGTSSLLFRLAWDRF